MSVGHWGSTPAIVCYGRVHFYEGHPWERVTRLVNLVADMGVKLLVLTNAAGGIRSDLNPGDLMAIQGHLKLLNTDAWRVWAEKAESPNPYSPRLLKRMTELDSALPTGIYAALTGPTYETPAEIRALAYAGADAVGMSTAMEAEAGVARGLEVA
ncbi:MAG: purine-nucleoside phosphorylase, partial [Frankiales bacterium]|nr:purine-nucleoside phosphorylase [Frankiales bacterium]